MNPPLLARALVAATAPPAAFDVIDGDLHEEYAHRVSGNRAAADAWYWSQALRSIPPMLFYSRTRSIMSNIVTGAIVVAMLFTMLVANEAIGDAIHHAFPDAQGFGAWPYFVVGWLLAACTGLGLAASVRSRGLRLTMTAALSLVAAIAVPIALGYSSQLTLPTWILVLGAVPAMCAGTATFQIIRRRS